MLPYTFGHPDDAGTLVAAGSPERVVRLWDPRAAGSRGGQSIAGLIGHTDNIRAILLSQDGRHVRALASLPSSCTPANDTLPYPIASVS